MWPDCPQVNQSCVKITFAYLSWISTFYNLIPFLTIKNLFNMRFPNICPTTVIASETITTIQQDAAQQNLVFLDLKVQWAKTPFYIRLGFNGINVQYLWTGSSGEKKWLAKSFKKGTLQKLTQCCPFMSLFLVCNYMDTVFNISNSISLTPESEYCSANSQHKLKVRLK